MRGNTVAVAVAIVAGWGLAFGIPRDFTVGHFVDDAQYALLAKSLRERLEYRNLNLPDELAETKFPPLFPAVLAAVWSPARDDLENVDRLRYVNLVLLGPLAGALAMMGIVALKLPPAPAVGAALAGLATSDTTALWVIPLSEPLFLLLLAIGITLLAARRGLAGAVTLALATYARTVGIVFLAAV